jgi:hypothetical protein
VSGKSKLPTPRTCEHTAIYQSWKEEAIKLAMLDTGMCFSVQPGLFDPETGIGPVRHEEWRGGQK